MILDVIFLVSQHVVVIGGYAIGIAVVGCVVVVVVIVVVDFQCWSSSNLLVG